MEQPDTPTNSQIQSSGTITIDESDEVASLHATDGFIADAPTDYGMDAHVGVIG
jgi:hypothetical protein